MVFCVSFCNQYNIIDIQCTSYYNVAGCNFHVIVHGVQCVLLPIRYLFLMISLFALKFLLVCFMPVQCYKEHLPYSTSQMHNPLNYAYEYEKIALLPFRE